MEDLEGKEAEENMNIHTYWRNFEAFEARGNNKSHSLGGGRNLPLSNLGGVLSCGLQIGRFPKLPCCSRVLSIVDRRVASQSPDICFDLSGHCQYYTFDLAHYFQLDIPPSDVKQISWPVVVGIIGLDSLRNPELHDFLWTWCPLNCCKWLNFGP